MSEDLFKNPIYLREQTSNKIEKPPILFHGSLTSDIQQFEPRTRHIPYEGIGDRIYATHLPAFAAAHSWDWSSNEGVDTKLVDGKVILEVPVKLKERLNVPIYIYALPSKSFNFTSKEGTGNTWDSAEKVIPLSVERFNSVVEAITHFGGEVAYI